MGLTNVSFVNQTAGECTAANVRAELARRRISGRELARGIGWSAPTTFRRLRGDTPFTIDELIAVARFLGVPVAALIPADTERVPA